MSEFDPFGDASAGREAWRERLDTARRGDDFDPWADAATGSRTNVHRGLELPSDAPGLGSLWGDEDPAQAIADSEAPCRGGRILVVCTGNVCRSPYIHLRLAYELSGLGVEVTSAGTGALVDRPVDPGSFALLRAVGIDASSFRARQLTTQLVQDVDLVLTAARTHRRLVVQEAPVALRKTFAFTDFADLVDDMNPDALTRVGGDTLIARVTAAALERRHLVPARSDEDADIIDPFRRGPEVFAQMERETVPSLERLVAAIRRASQG